MASGPGSENNSQCIFSFLASSPGYVLRYNDLDVLEQEKGKAFRIKSDRQLQEEMRFCTLHLAYGTPLENLQHKTSMVNEFEI